MSEAQETLSLAVCGLHLQGQPLNWQLTDLGATLYKLTKTAPSYKLYALPTPVTFPCDTALGKGVPTQGVKPAMIYAPSGDGAAVEVEVWSVPKDKFGIFIANVPAPLCIGTLLLEDGSTTLGFLGEEYATRADNARDITLFGSWREYIASGK